LGEPWGCRILVSDFLEADGSYRKGSLYMDSVSVYNCSQKATYKAAIKWEQAVLGRSKVSNSVIHSGKGMGILIHGSNNVELDNNNIISFVENGIWAKNSGSITITNNWVHDVIPWVDEEPKMYEYPRIWPIGAMTLTEGTRTMTVRNNVVSGSWHHGYHFKPARCTGSSADFVFENNVAHSISGYGAIALNVENDCTEVKDFWSYKVTEAAIMLGGGSNINKGTNIHSIDTRYGIAVHSAGPEHGAEDPRAELHNCKVYAELKDNMDCAPGQACDHCVDRTGMMLN
jgi:nitrous oxidase accessory protein NosD